MCLFFVIQSIYITSAKVIYDYTDTPPHQMTHRRQPLFHPVSYFESVNGQIILEGEMKDRFEEEFLDFIKKF